MSKEPIKSPFLLESEFADLKEVVESGFCSIDRQFGVINRTFASVDIRIERSTRTDEEKFALIDQRFVVLEGKIDDLAERMTTGFDRIYAEMDKRFEESNQRFVKIEKRLDLLEKRMDSLEEQLNMLKGKVEDLTKQMGIVLNILNTMSKQITQIHDKMSA